MKNLIKRMPSLLNCILIALFASVIVTSYMTIDLLAKFTTYAEVEDAARTAGFTVTLTEDAENGDIALDAFDSSKLLGQYKFSISSRSEVAAKYAVAIDIPGGLPDYASVMLDEKTPTESKNTETGVVTYRFEDATWVYAPNSTNANSHTLTFGVNPGWQGTGSDVSIEKLSVAVRVEQVD